jgi:hypothetical protein
MLRSVGLRHHHPDIPTENFGGTVAEQAFGGRIEGFDQALLVDGDDPIDRDRENCGGLALVDPRCPPADHRRNANRAITPLSTTMPTTATV